MAGWHEVANVHMHPRFSPQKRAPETANVVVGGDSYPQSASDGVSAIGYSWLASLQSDEEPLEPLSKSSGLSLLWKVPCGPGHGAPTGFHDLIVLITGGEEGVDLHAYQLATGESPWSQCLSTSAVRPLHHKGAATTSTPVVVGERVVVCWSDMQQVWMASFDGEGKEDWRIGVGATNAQWRFNSSPAHYRGLVFINVDNQEAGFVSAFDAESGKLVWRQARPDGFEGSYSSPLVIADESGEAIVVLAGLKIMTALDGASGRILWTLPAVSDVSAATPVFSNSYLVASSGYRHHRLSVNEFRNGIFLPPIEVWSRNRASEVPYVPTPLLSADKIFVMHDDGIAQCYALASGKTIWKKRLGTAITASPMWLRGSILVCGESGAMLLVDSRSGDLIDSKSLSEPILASPCVTGERLLIRTQRDLQCFRNSVAQ